MRHQHTPVVALFNFMAQFAVRKAYLRLLPFHSIQHYKAQGQVPNLTTPLRRCLVNKVY
jgi:hypothetical protein